MTLTSSVALFSAVALAIVLALLARERRSQSAQRVRLHELMRLRGVPPPRPRDQAAARDAAAATRRCVACASKQMCDELLRTGDSEGYRRFCPNALYLEWLRSNSLHFD
jgi:uncharacterized protein DUF6455